ncbi:hypothetical protein [Arthrobacter hankyongi]|uniref:hypothetical protein n=1 Tax=Arthrobacter hankyongi TaxID=2904801 RepID=UPI0035580974
MSNASSSAGVADEDHRAVNGAHHGCDRVDMVAQPDAGQGGRVDPVSRRASGGVSWDRDEASSQTPGPG